MESFEYYPGRIPLLVSIPHGGTELSPEVAANLSKEAALLPDTDWHVPVLYQFAREMGAHVLRARYSRMMIDLNRPADDQPLYQSATTGLFPSTLFDGTPSFQPGRELSPRQRRQHLEEIWQPYHHKIQSVLDEIKARFGYAVLFDAHSIASRIPRLFEGPLPDLNLGTNKGVSLLPQVQQALAGVCENQSYSWVINGRFTGGYITRAYGRPEEHLHALQLELAQCNYMEETPPFAYDSQKAGHLIPVLERIVRTLVEETGRCYHGETDHDSGKL